MNSSKIYLIDEIRLKNLLKESRLLAALLNGGVDNWEWYGESINQFEINTGEDIDNISTELETFDLYK